MFYYLSLGSNILPEENSVNMIRALLEEFTEGVFYPFIYTQPEDIDSQNVFLNSLAVIFSHKTPEEFKGILNNIETKLGRNRKDPDKSIKDRPADIDILSIHDRYDTHIFDAAEEIYISDIISNSVSRADLQIYGLPSTQGPTTIHLESGSGNIRIVDQAGNGLKHREKTTFE